jgi:hypothetical protein
VCDSSAQALDPPHDDISCGALKASFHNKKPGTFKGGGILGLLCAVSKAFSLNKTPPFKICESQISMVGNP